MRAALGTLRDTRASMELLSTLLLVSVATGLVGHVALDFVANLALAHDPYDDLAHGSRIATTLVVGGLATLAALRALCALVVDAADGRVRVRTHALLHVSRPLLVGAVTVLGLAVLVALETTDLLVAGVRITDVATLLGGSVPLAFATLATCATASCFAARALVRRLVDIRPSLVRKIATMFAAFVRGAVRGLRAVATFARDRFRPRTLAPRRVGKRGPPRLLTR